MALAIFLCLNFSIIAVAASSEDAADGFDVDKTSAQIAREMKIGWNLGNTLDAWDGTGLDSETSWGNPKTTEKMILDIKAMGFCTVRVPVTWSIHVDDAGNVDSEWMARVKEVVDYAYNNDMYVILNSHHDDSFFDMGGCMENENTCSENITKMANLWTQIANTFKDYDERLVFETMNEPRTVGSENEWLGGTDGEYKILFALNSAIAKAIRSTGGNNAYRHIMVPAYAATPLTKVLRKLELPDDDRIIVSIHAYSPYSFAMDENGPSDFKNSDKRELDKFFSDLNKIFISKGIPVVIGEFGATNKNNLDARCEWAEYYVKGAGKYGIPCAVWDNNIGTESGAECWGLYDRATGEWLFPEIAEIMVTSADEALSNVQETKPDITLTIALAVIAVVVLILIIFLIKRKNRFHK